MILLKYHAVESISKDNHSVISDFIFMLNADDVTSSSLLKYAANELWVTCRNKYKLKVALVLSYHLLELLSTYKLTAAFIIF